MSDALVDPVGGPDGMYSSDLAPSRGQFEAMAVACLDLLGLDPPKTRLEATVLLTRLHIAQETNPAAPRVRIDPIDEF